MPFHIQNQEELNQYIETYNKNPVPKACSIMSPLFADLLQYLNKKEEDTQEKFNQMQEKFIQKINSQENEIEFLKKTALAQEIKINDLETLVNKWMIVHSAAMENNIVTRENPVYGRIYHVLTKHLCDLQLYRVQMLNKAVLDHQEAEEKERKSIEDAAALVLEQKKQEEDKAKTDKAMKDMMARVALLEETAKNEELELENLKLVSEMEQAIEITTDMEQLLVREANALARAAEMRSEKAKLRGKQKNQASSSNDPATWSKEKAEKIGKMWCE